MRNKILCTLCTVFFFFTNAQIKTIILKNQDPKTYISIRITNNTDKKLIIFTNFLYSDYDIYRESDDKLIAFYAYSNVAGLDFYNFQDNFSSDLIKETETKYNLSTEKAFYFLENKKTSIVIEPYTKKDILLRVFYSASKPSVGIEDGKYYLKGKIVFTTDTFPKKYISWLKRKRFTILNEIEISKTEIDINDFFLKKD